MRRAEIQRGGSFCKSGEHVEFGDRGGDALQLRDERCELVEQLFVEKFLACQRAFVRGQRLVLEGLELRRDVALGVLQRLAAAVVVRHLARIGGAHLDVEAVHAVVFDLELVDAGARPLARFQRQQKIAAVGLDAAQFVQLGIVAVGDHAAFAQHA